MANSGKAEFIDYYQLLGIPPSADIALIRRAFLQKAKEHHPDIGGSTHKMQLLNRAYKTLMDATAKASYDMTHSFHTDSTKPSQYTYQNGRVVREISDMTDEEIDKFLDIILSELRSTPPAPKFTIKERLKKFWAI